MINDLPTVFDVVTGKKPVKEKTSVNNSGGNKAKSTGSKVVRINEYILVFQLGCLSCVGCNFEFAREDAELILHNSLARMQLMIALILHLTGGIAHLRAIYRGRREMLLALRILDCLKGTLITF
jgi:hypothetical protein